MNTEQALEKLFKLSEKFDQARLNILKRLGILEMRMEETMLRFKELDASSHVHEYVDLAEHPEVENEVIESLTHKCPSCGYEGHPIKSRTGELLCPECKKVYGSIGKTIPYELLEDEELQPKIEEKPE